VGRNACHARTPEAGIAAGAISTAAAMSVQEVFQRITAALDRAGIGYMLTGSFASAYYGAPRSTQDIDLVIEATPEQMRPFIHGLILRRPGCGPGSSQAALDVQRD